MPTGDFYGSCLNCYGGRCTYCHKYPVFYNPIQYYYTPPKTKIIEKFDDKGNLIERITETI